jgi:hypothetical protein
MPALKEILVKGIKAHNLRNDSSRVVQYTRENTPGDVKPYLMFYAVCPPDIHAIHLDIVKQ